MGSSVPDKQISMNCVIRILLIPELWEGERPIPYEAFYDALHIAAGMTRREFNSHFRRVRFQLKRDIQKTIKERISESQRNS